jgi:hypothetical protein
MTDHLATDHPTPHLMGRHYCGSCGRVSQRLRSLPAWDLARCIHWTIYERGIRISENWTISGRSAQG